jgi:hypothetical protein
MHHNTPAASMTRLIRTLSSEMQILAATPKGRPQAMPTAISIIMLLTLLSSTAARRTPMHSVVQPAKQNSRHVIRASTMLPQVDYEEETYANGAEDLTACINSGYAPRNMSWEVAVHDALASLKVRLEWTTACDPYGKLLHHPCHATL